MSIAKDTFVPVFGKPNPSAPNGIKFQNAGAQGTWRVTYPDVGSGWYMDRFLLLFARGLDRLKACLEAWSFLVPPARDRMIVGRNAYGAILVLENANSFEERAIHVLDPFRVVYWTSPGLDFFNMIATWLPENMIPHFLDTKLYDAWLKARGKPLEENVILAPKTPLGLGGTMKAKNFQEEDIFAFYESSGPVYAAAFEKMGRSAPARGKKGS